jgi:multiple sugar transport system substrate-binding protein
MIKHTEGYTRRLVVSRRQFLGIALGASAGLSGVLRLHQPPAIHAQKRTLNVLTTANYVPASDKKLEEQVQEFAKQAGVTIKVDHLRSEQMPAKLAAEVTTQSGHDVIELDLMAAWLHQTHLVDVSDLAAEITKGMGDFYQFGPDSAFVNGHWLGIPYFWISFPGSYRKDLFEQVGEKPPDTWDELLRAGRKLKPIGHPVGVAISQCTDAVQSMLSILWSYGGKVMEADGTTIALNSQETAESIKYVKVLYNETMEPEVLSWDNAGNNRFMTAGKGSWIQNPASHYISAKTSKLKVAEQIYFHQTPAGPRGRHTVVNLRSMGVWKFSNEVELGKDLIIICSTRNATSTTSPRATTIIIPSLRNSRLTQSGTSIRSTSPSKRSASTRICTRGQPPQIRKRRLSSITTSLPICTPRRSQERLPKMPSPGLRGKSNASTKKASRGEWDGRRCRRSSGRRAEKSSATGG